MLKDLKPVSSWYVLHNNFKVYSECPGCKSKNISYYKIRMKDHKGIAPECDECGKQLSMRLKPIRKIEIEKCSNF